MPMQPQTPTPNEQIMQVATSYIASACLCIAAQLKVADLLAGGPKPLFELARDTRTNEDALYRVLRAIASVGVFTETAPRTFANTPASETLRSGAPGSLRDLAIWISDPFHLQVHAALMHSVKTGEPAVKKVTGMDAFDYFAKDKAEGDGFNAAMTNLSAMVIPAVLEVYDFSGFGTLADIAGGHGFVLTSILQKHSDIKGILFEVPHVVPGAKARIESLGLGSRCQIVEGDFFKSVPPADNYVMKHVIHDWEDARAIAILRNCAHSMRGKGKVILIESVLAAGNEPHFAKWIDIEMLAFPGGRERTEKEFADLFSKSGLKLSRVVPTKSPLSVVEGIKA